MKMIVTDLDGTLLRNDKTISERTLNAIRKLQSTGVKFVIATARAPRSVMKLLPFDFLNIYTICYNGAEIFKNNEMIYEKHIAAEITANITHWFLANYTDINISLEIFNHLYTNFNISKIKGWIPPYSQIDFNSFEFKPAAKILVDLRDIQDRNSIFKMLPDSCSMIITDGGTLGQIAHVDVSKINGIKNLIDILDINIGDVMAFGDDFNDLDMLIQCGIGIAMDNAPLEVKTKADIITATNDEDGVALQLEKMMLAGGYI